LLTANLDRFNDDAFRSREAVNLKVVHSAKECHCGCGELITTEDAYIRWEDEYFTDRSCVMKYLKKTFDVEEVG